MITQKNNLSEGFTEFINEGLIEPVEIIDIVKFQYLNNSKNVLWNMSAADVSGFTSDDMYRISCVAKKYAIHEKTAFYGTTDLFFGMGRMYEQHSEMMEVLPQVRVFRDRNEAVKWLTI